MGILTNEKLSFSFNGYKELPTSVVAQLTWNRGGLRVLILDRNELIRLPQMIGTLGKLEQLDISYNYLTRLPDSIGKCSALQILNLEVNERFQTLPDSIGDLQALTELNCQSCKLELLPDTFGGLTSLKYLKLGKNELKSLPASIGQLHSLVEMALQCNQLEELPPSVGGLVSLSKLWLNSNRLSALPDEIGGCVSLTFVNVDGNQLTMLPEAMTTCSALESLSIEDNQFEALPAWLGPMPRLKTVKVCPGNDQLKSSEYPSPTVPVYVEEKISPKELWILGVLDAKATHMLTLRREARGPLLSSMRAEARSEMLYLLPIEKQAQLLASMTEEEADGYLEYLSNKNLDKWLKVKLALDKESEAPSEEMMEEQRKRAPPSFADSRYREVYSSVLPANGEIYTIKELRKALEGFIRLVAEHPTMGLDQRKAAGFAKGLEQPGRAGSPLGRQLTRGLSSLTAAPALTTFAVRVWTSSLRWSGREFCSLLNQIIREDGHVAGDEALRHAIVICRALNQVLCRANEEAAAMHVWPRGPNGGDGMGRSDEANTTFRGGGLPAELRSFFQVGTKFRTRQYTATSFQRSVAVTFAEQYRTPPSAHPIIWIVKLPLGGCLHVNLVEKLTQVSGEYEFLFPPYSVFTVEAVDWTEPRWSITISAAADNRAEPEYLPTAPWC